MSTSTSACVPATRATRSPRIDVVTTTCGRPSEVAGVVRAAAAQPETAMAATSSTASR